MFGRDDSQVIGLGDQFVTPDGGVGRWETRLLVAEAWVDVNGLHLRKSNDNLSNDNLSTDHFPEE